MTHLTQNPSDLGYAFAAIFGITAKALTNSWIVSTLLFVIGFIAGVVVTFHLQQKAKKGERR